MRHLKRGRKLKRTSSHKKALMKNLATALFEHKKIATTEAKAKELRPYAEKLMSKAKHALQNEKQGLLPEGQTIDIHNRRIVGKHIRSKAVLQELFDTIAPMIEERQGGYTRIVKTGYRRGDAGRTAIIELVDWAAPQDGAASIKAKKKAKARKPAPDAKAGKKPVETAPAVVEEEVIDVIEEVEETETNEIETADAAEVVESVEAPAVEETPVAEAPATEEAQASPSVEDAEKPAEEDKKE